MGIASAMVLKTEDHQELTGRQAREEGLTAVGLRHTIIGLLPLRRRLVISRTGVMAETTTETSLMTVLDTIYPHPPAKVDILFRALLATDLALIVRIEVTV